MNRENGMALGRTLVLALLFGALLLLSVEVGVCPVLASDQDGDGLSDALEQALGTDHMSSDTCPLRRNPCRDLTRNAWS